MGKLSKTVTYERLAAVDDAFLGRVSRITFNAKLFVKSTIYRAAVPLGIYNILSRKSIALQVQPQILAVLSLITWTQVMYYGHRWTFLKSTCTFVLLCILGAGVELLGILPFMLARADSTAPEAYLLAMAILSAVGLGLGVLRHYWDIYTHRNVRGISFLFVGLDAAGDLTSLLSVGAF